MDYADYLVTFELFYRNICNLGILSNQDLDFVKTRTKETVPSSYRNYNNNVPQHLSKEQFVTLQNLCKNKNIIIQKSDKGDSVVIVDKADYLDKMENLLRWWFYDLVLPGWNFNSSSRDRFHPAITWRNQFSSRQGGTGFYLVFVYKILSRISAVQKKDLLCQNEIFYMWSQDIIYDEFITLPESWPNRKEFHYGQPESCNQHLNDARKF